MNLLEVLIDRQGDAAEFVRRRRDCPDASGLSVAELRRLLRAYAERFRGRLAEAEAPMGRASAQPLLHNDGLHGPGHCFRTFSNDVPRNGAAGLGTGAAEGSPSAAGAR